MRKTLSILLVFLLATTSYSCKNKKEDASICPSFDETTLNTWLPYTNTNKTFSFSNGQGHSETLKIKSYSSTFQRAKTATVGWEEGIPYCLAEGYIYSDTTIPNALSLYIAHLQERFDDGTYHNNMMLTFNTHLYVTINVESNTLNLRQPVAWQLEEKKLSQLTTPIRVYNEVIQVNVLDSAKATKANTDRLYIAKGYGIVGYRSYPEQREYWLQ